MDVAASPGLFAGAEARLSSSVMGGHPKHLWAVGPLGAVTMLPSMGRCPALSSAPVQSDTGWEVGTP